VLQMLWSTARSPEREGSAPTRLTRRRYREAQGGPPLPPAPTPPKPQSFCKICGVSVVSDRQYCPSCAVTFRNENIVQAAISTGWAAAHSAKAEALRGEAQRRQHAARAKWVAESLPPWLTEDAYNKKIQPMLANVTTTAIATALGVSWAYASRIHRGVNRPHPRHWLKLAELVGV
jgi:hypothetical protein